MPTVPFVPRWGVLSSAAAPVLLIGGWTLAAHRQPAAYDAVRDTISELAAVGATDRWIMTSGLVGLGVCHATTALALRPAAMPGRVVLGIGGVATVAVGAFPLPVEGSSGAHGLSAAVAFVALAVWPAVAGRSATTGRAGRRTPWGLRRPAALAAAAVLLGLVGWFAIELAGDTARVGLAERAAAGAQALWPLTVVLSRRAARG